ncbi:Golgin subfamily A member 6-like protein 2 [Tritrichomonas foetus]|uniref:Golgin subfamily A member 6-like protein 2 n=1 Tax=Tritrichomonas foetus TaxID=1144522 RepID=A0A1J4JYY7_9EUKA|nr:Golgin subfamily A member 6-like protein 2 [Tritrichomonas foetus]|eukprot:OHT03696.1 Golgin subfamily A member 6-like protein 2 [Tritrichomonas foetus]
MTILSNISNEENDGDELAFPESEEIIPFVDKYSDIYDQLEEWLTDKEKQIEEFNTHHQQLKAVYDELKQQNEELKAKLSEEPDLSGEIETIKEEINKKISTMKSKEEILELNRQKSEELNSLIKAIDASQQEEKREVIKEDKEVNVQQLNELQLKCFRKWEELRQIKYEQYLHERDMKHYLAVIKSQIPNFDV